MEESLDLKIIVALEEVKRTLEDLKAEPLRYDGRSLSIAITHLETAQLWFANSRKDTSL